MILLNLSISSSLVTVTHDVTSPMSIHLSLEFSLRDIPVLFDPTGESFRCRVPDRYGFVLDTRGKDVDNEKSLLFDQT